MSLLSWLLVTLAGLSLAVMVISLSIANRSAREARATIFPIVREEEITRARRARIATGVTGVIAAIMAGAFFLSGLFPAPAFLPQQPPAEVVAISESPIAGTQVLSAPTETPLPPTAVQATQTSSRVVLVTSQPPANPTTPLSATSTPVPPTLTLTLAPSATATRVPASPTPAGSPVAAPAGVQIGPIDFARQVTSRREAISPTTVFSDTVSRVYAVFPYDGMRDGLTWTHVWYFNGVEFNRGEETWRWGSADRSYVFTRLVGAGNYRLELYINDDLLASGNFTVQGPVAIGGPTTAQSSGTPESPGTLESPGTPETSATPESQETPENLATPESLGTPESSGSP